MTELHPDFPKLECPFIRKRYKINRADWALYGKEMGLRTPEVYLITPEVNPGLEWVFEDDVYAVEKLHGTGILIDVRDGCLHQVQNRKHLIPFTKLIGKQAGLLPSGRILEGILEAASRNYVENNKVQYGEFIGPSINKNIHRLEKHLWYPFSRAREQLRYIGFSNFPKDFWVWNEWFRIELKSILYCRLNKIHLSQLLLNPDVPFTEGVVLYRDMGFDEERQFKKAKMSKLRRDMYDWYYGENIEILGLEDWRIDAAKYYGYRLKGYTDPHKTET